MSDFLSGYKTYDPETEGYGGSRSWRREFFKKMTDDEAWLILQEDDPWEVLGIDRGASKEVIKGAWRKLVLKYHPDRNQGDKKAEAMTKKINAAYSLLT